MCCLPVACYISMVLGSESDSRREGSSTSLSSRVRQWFKNGWGQWMMFPGWSWCFEFPSVRCFNTVVLATGGAVSVYKTCCSHPQCVWDPDRAPVTPGKKPGCVCAWFVCVSAWPADEDDGPVWRHQRWRLSSVTAGSFVRWNSGNIALTVASAMEYVCLYYNGPVDILPSIIVMVALCNRADHYIFALWFLSSIYLLFFPRLISAAADWMSTILLHMAWP